MVEGDKTPIVYTDENVPDVLYNSLLGLGVEAKRARDNLELGALDSDHLKLCADNSWVLITIDRKDFQRLHWLWTSLHSWDILNAQHGGILSVNQDPPLAAEWASSIAQIVGEKGSNLAGTMWLWRLSTKKWEAQGLKLP